MKNIDLLPVKKLKRKGYSVQSNMYGYRVELNNVFVYAAGSERKPKHWRHQRADLKEYCYLGWLTAFKHFNKH